jgi:hypothetical protein
MAYQGKFSQNNTKELGVLREDTMENKTQETEHKERSEFFWHTYYGFPSEMLGYALLIITLLFVVFVIMVAAGAL